MDFVIYYLIVFSLIPLSLNSIYKKNKYKGIIIGEYMTPYKLNMPLFFSIIAYSLLVGCAYDTGQDYYHYFDHYVSEVNHRIDYWGENRELGYQLFVRLLSSIFESPTAFFISCAILNSIAWSMVSSLYGKASGYIMFILYMFLFSLSLNLFRQYIAIALLLILFTIIVTRKDKYSIKDCSLIILFLILTFNFHTSSLAGIVLYIVCYLIRNLKINKWLIMGTIAFVTIMADTVLLNLFSELNYIINTFHSVSNREYSLAGMIETQWNFSRMTYIMMIIHIIYIWYAEKVLTYNSHSKFLYYSMTLAFILIPLSMQEILLRIRLYIIPFMAIGLGLTLYLNLRKNSIDKSYPLIIAFFIDFLYFCLTLYNHGINFPLQYYI